MQTFTLTIALGNDAMQTPADVADALRDVGERLVATHGPLGWIYSEANGAIRDLNGNTVGQYAAS